MLSSILAVSIKVVLVLVAGEHALEPCEARALFAQAEERLEKAIPKLDLKLWGVKEVAGSKALFVLDSRLPDYFTLRQELKSHLREKSILVVIAPPLISQTGGKFIGGVAQQTCGLSQYPMVVVNTFTEESTHYGPNALAHELGHILGAYHDDDTQLLMHSNALFYSKNAVLPLSYISKKQIRKCLKRYSKNASE